MSSFAGGGAMMGGGGMGGAQENAATASSSSSTNAPQTIDLNTLAAYVQQAQAQAQSRGAAGAGAATSPAVPPGIQEALASIVKGLQQNPNQNQNAIPPVTTNTTNATDGSSQGADTTMADADKNKSSANDPQGLMEQVAQLTKSLDMEKAKSRALQQEKAREMKGFLNGIKEFVTNLDGVKDPESKTKFLKGIENMADHGIPNGVYDIMVSASAQNEQNMRTIEALTKGYTEMKEKYEGAGQFTKESSRFVDPTIKIVDAGSKRKTMETEENKVPLGLWDAFGDDIARVGYGHQKDLLSGF
jgi:soluble cytochrome b562